MRRTMLTSLALTLTAPLAAQTAPLPPEMPWRGASEKLIAKPGSKWITPAEAAGFERTPDYAATRAFAEKLVAASPLLTLEVFGRSPEGRDLFLIRASKGPGRPVVLAQAGIHAGEIDGKDAGFMLLRDIAFGGKAALLDKADLVLVPIFNVDGHERASRYSRPNQRGPMVQGWRTTAQNLNLNRDYLKADAPEMQAMLGLIRRLDPILYLDLHVTDGIDYQYDITYDFNGLYGKYANSREIGRWLDQRLRPAFDRNLTAAGHVPTLYIDALDNRAPEKGIAHSADTPRFSTGWGDYARVPTVLLETHSLKNYRRRVLGTYVFVETALKTAGDEAEALRRAIDADRADTPRELVTTWKNDETPLFVMDFKGISNDRYQSPASGREELRWTGQPVALKVPVIGQSPAEKVTMPRAWWIPASATAILKAAGLQGIRMEVIDAPREIELDMARVEDPKLGAASEGHVPLSGRIVHERRRITMPAGSMRVPADQPLGLLAAALLEPESGEGALAWNLTPAMLARTEYIEGYAIAPLADAMLADDPELAAAFRAKLAAEPDFAADPQARLAWFYQRTPYYDARYLLYPVGREVR
ncbi:M14 family metallopeptidase [Sphingomonas sp. IW22]|uniref:M14 family metallopeptidase n=1 Tax=Sphingomonas sp. IW22 TaxID=3242489 RepID=UPI003522F378